MAYHKETQCIQSGWTPKNGEPRVLPIYQSTTFAYDTAQEMGDLFDLKSEGFFYSRLANPTVAAVENKISDLEGGVGALLCSSGQSATLLSIINIAHSGDHVICSSAVYGGTFNLLHKTLQEMGIEVEFVDPDISLEELHEVFRSNTRCVFSETLTNPSLVVLDIEKFAEAAHAHDVPLIVDNTFPTPINCNPFQFGADIVTHSTTKYMDGHACSLGGVVIDSGNFDWATTRKYPEFTKPDESYHGVIYAESFGKAAYIVKARTHLMRDVGAMMAPMNAFLLNLGLETLAIRMERHCSNALAIAKFLEKHPKVSWITYPDLESSPYHALAKKYMPHGSCGVISFGVKGGRDAACKFMEAMKIARIVTHVADVRTCCLHPASTTHRQMSDEQLEACGVKPDLIRFSTGIEHVDDLIADISQALKQL
jgi:O-acetylhomoserine (thiol)-lyase